MGTDIGVDMATFTVGPKFRGIKLIPPGLHFLHWAARSQKSGAVGTKSGFFFRSYPGSVLVAYWDAQDESLQLGQPTTDGGDAQAARLAAAVRALSFDTSLGAFPVHTPLHGVWTSQTRAMAHPTILPMLLRPLSHADEPDAEADVGATPEPAEPLDSSSSQSRQGPASGAAVLWDGSPGAMAALLEGERAARAAMQRRPADQPQPQQPPSAPASASAAAAAATTSPAVVGSGYAMLSSPPPGLYFPGMQDSPDAASLVPAELWQGPPLASEDADEVNPKGRAAAGAASMPSPSSSSSASSSLAPSLSTPASSSSSSSSSAAAAATSGRVDGACTPAPSEDAARAEVASRAAGEDEARARARELGLLDAQGRLTGEFGASDLVGIRLAAGQIVRGVPIAGLSGVAPSSAAVTEYAVDTSASLRRLVSTIAAELERERATIGSASGGRVPSGFTPVGAGGEMAAADVALPLEQLPRGEDGARRVLLAELEVSFVCMLVGQSLEALQRWKSLVDCVCRCEGLLLLLPPPPSLASRFRGAAATSAASSGGFGWEEFLSEAFACVTRQLDLAPAEFLGMGDAVLSELDGRSPHDEPAEEDGHDEDDEPAGARSLCEGSESAAPEYRQHGRSADSTHFVARALTGLARILRDASSGSACVSGAGGEAGIPTTVRAAAEALLRAATFRFDWQPPARPEEEEPSAVSCVQAGESVLCAADVAKAIAQLRLTGAIGDEDDVPTFVA